MTTEKERTLYKESLLCAVETLAATDRHLATAVGALSFGRERREQIALVRQHLTAEAAKLMALSMAADLAEQTADRMRQADADA